MGNGSIVEKYIYKNLLGRGIEILTLYYIIYTL